MNVAGPKMISGDLEATVQLLQDELETTNREVMLLTLELEQRVAERTAELANSNQQLIKEVAQRIRAAAQISQLNKDLERRAALLEATNQELEAFSYSVSHDLRTPLAQIVGFASLLQEGADKISGDNRRKYLARICETGLMMGSMIDDLLRLSHSSQAELHWAQVNLNPLIAEVIGDFEQETQRRNVEWNCGPLPTVLGDASLLRHLFVNLLSNALKYSRQRNPAKIQVGAVDRSPEDWTIFVRDNGVGFDPAKAGKLFGAFQRLHRSQEFEGTGVGLANVRRIVLRHGGKVWAEAIPEKGATFYVSLPKQQSADNTTPRQESSKCNTES